MLRAAFFSKMRKNGWREQLPRPENICGSTRRCTERVGQPDHAKDHFVSIDDKEWRKIHTRSLPDRTSTATKLTVRTDRQAICRNSEFFYTQWRDFQTNASALQPHGPCMETLVVPIGWLFNRL